MVRLAVIGGGIVGRTLARAWVASDHEVVIGSRTPASASVPAGAVVGDVLAAIAGAEIVVYALPGAAMPAALQAHGPALAGRIVIDTTNNLAAGHAGADLSAIRHLPPEVPAFRAFNTVGWENMADPFLAGERADLLYAGPDGPERSIISRLITDVGFRPVYVGGTPEALAAVDALATLWFVLALGRGYGRRLAFRVLTDKENLS